MIPKKLTEQEKYDILSRSTPENPYIVRCNENYDNNNTKRKVGSVLAVSHNGIRYLVSIYFHPGQSLNSGHDDEIPSNMRDKYPEERVWNVPLSYVTILEEPLPLYDLSVI